MKTVVARLGVCIVNPAGDEGNLKGTTRRRVDQRALVFSRKASESVEGHIEGISADGDSDEHFEKEDGDSVFVPGFAGDGVGVLCFWSCLHE